MEQLDVSEHLGEQATARSLLRHVLRDGRRDVTFGSLLVMTHQAAEALVPVVVGVVIDRAVETADAAALVRWVALLALLFVCLSTAGCIGSYVYERVVVRGGHEARLVLVRRVLDPRGGADAENLPGELVSLATVDTNRIGEGMGAVLLGAGAVVGTVGTAVMLLVTSVRLGLVVLIGLPLVLVAVRALSRPLERRSGAEHEAVAAASGVATDLMSGLRVLKGLGAEDSASARYRRASRTALHGALRTARVEGAYEGLTITMGGAFLVVVAWVGGRLALDGHLTVGQLVAALGLTQFLVGPLTRVAFVAAALAQAQAAAGRIAAVCAAPPSSPDGAASLPAPVRGGLRVRVGHARDGHGDEDGQVPRDGHGHEDGEGGSAGDGSGSSAGIPADGGTGTGSGSGSGSGSGRNAGPAGSVGPGTAGRADSDAGIDLDVAPGEIVGVVCSAPTDAVLLLDLVAGSGDGASNGVGDTTLDGVRLADVALDERRRAVVVARHDAPLVEDTLGDNVSVAAASPPQVEAALRTAGVDEIVELLPGGLDGTVGEDGRSLSGGQRQRVALARALATDAPVLVLDEPLTAVDAVTEQQVAERLRELRTGRTTVLVTSSPALLAVADRVVVVEGGRAVAEGRHAELAAHHEGYRTAVLS